MDASTAAAVSTFKYDLYQLVTQTTELMAAHGCDRRYRAVSPGLSKVLQRSADTWVGQTDEALAAQPQSAEMQTYWRQVAEAISTVFQQGEAVRRVHTLPTATGLQRYETTYTPLKDEQAQLCQILSISRAAPPTPAPLTAENAFVGVEMPGLETASLSHLSAARSQSAPPPPHLPTKPAKKDADRRANPEAIPAHHTAEFLQIVLDSIPQYIFWKNRDSVYLGSNHRWAQMAGLGDPSNVVGITDDDLPWTQSQKEWYATCDRQVMEADTPMLRIKQSQRQADGQLSWRETSKFPLHDAAGNVVGLLGTIEDITERKIAEDLLKQSEQTFRSLAKRGELLNQISTQIRQSLKLESIQQITVEEVRQLFAVERVFIYRFDSDWKGQVAVESVADSYQSILGDTEMNSRFHQQYIEQYQQGHSRAIADIAAAELDTGHREYLQTLQVQANLVVPILVQENLWGLLIAHQCSGPRHWEDDEIDLLRTLAGQVGVAIHQSNLFSQAQSSATVAQEKAQQLADTLQSLKRAQTQLIQTEKMSSLGQMVAGIAHEINNPVNFIYGNLNHVKGYAHDLLEFLQLYETHYPNPETAIQTAAEALDIEFIQEDLGKTLSSIQIGTERIREIVLSLRNFSRIDESVCKAVDIHDGIDSTLLILGHRLKAQPHRPAITVVRDFGDLPPVECFASQLNQVFMNVLANAIDALESELQGTPAADKIPQITVRTQAQADSILISLADNGTGIPPAIREQIFDPFFTTKAVGKGTGMGMAISYQIVVEKHHGQIECVSEKGTGTEFVITLPVRVVPNENA
ncbi:MAG: ATP-binding protein [Phormidesmis sp.]